MIEHGRVPADAGHASPIAYADESYRMSIKIYVMSFVTVPAAGAEIVREVLRSLRPGGRLHWRELKPADQRRVAEAVAGLGIASSTWWVRVEMNTQQERARRKILAEALYILAGEGVSRVVLETQHRERNHHDAEVVKSFRRSRLLPGSMEVQHGQPLDEPLLWLPDVIAGAVGLSMDGDGAPLNLLGPRALVTQTAL